MNYDEKVNNWLVSELLDRYGILQRGELGVIEGAKLYGEIFVMDFISIMKKIVPDDNLELSNIETISQPSLPPRPYNNSVLSSGGGNSGSKWENAIDSVLNLLKKGVGVATDSLPLWNKEYRESLAANAGKYPVQNPELMMQMQKQQEAQKAKNMNIMLIVGAVVVVILLIIIFLKKR